MSTAKRRRDRARARRFFAGLSAAERGEIGDALVLGALDHAEWFGRRESRAFVSELDDQRIYWEQTE